MTEKFAPIINGLTAQGWAVRPGFISPQLVKSLREEQEILLEADRFKRAGVGKGGDHQVETEIRSDFILWFDQQNLSPRQQEYISLLHELKETLNRTLYLGLRNFDCHFAIYPPGSFYARHLDNFQQFSYRVLSCILYLNEDWQTDKGGQLRIYHAEGHVDIEPFGGTFVCFLSNEIEHEVLPTEQQRYSITGWFRDSRAISFM